MKTSILATVAAAACIALSASTAHAATDPLQNAVISASYNGDSASMLGLDHNFQLEAGSNVSHLDPSNTGIEFLSADYQFGFDFAANGHLTVYNNATIASGNYSASFDFGSSLGKAITGFSLVSSGSTSGLPVFTIVDSHTVSIDLSNVSWNSDFNSLEASITLQQPAPAVPEPSSAMLLLGGLGLLGLRRRKRSGQARIV